jgi:hypothetical protein
MRTGDLPLHGTKCDTNFYWKLYSNITTFTTLKALYMTFLIKYEICKLICLDLSLPHLHRRLKNAAQSRILLIGLHSIKCKCQFMKDLSVFKRTLRPSRQGFFMAKYCSVNPSHKTKCCALRSHYPCWVCRGYSQPPRGGPGAMHNGLCSRREWDGEWVFSALKLEPLARGANPNRKSEVPQS